MSGVRTNTMGRTEFITLCAMMFATIAFSIDAMLPALPSIGAELSPNDLNRAQLIVTSFVLGMGLGTAFTGPLSDAFGRKPVILAGGRAVYCGGGGGMGQCIAGMGAGRPHCSRLGRGRAADCDHGGDP